MFFFQSIYSPLDMEYLSCFHRACTGLLVEDMIKEYLFVGLNQSNIILIFTLIFISGHNTDSEMNIFGFIRSHKCPLSYSHLVS